MFLQSKLLLSKKLFFFCSKSVGENSKKYFGSNLQEISFPTAIKAISSTKGASTIRFRHA